MVDSRRRCVRGMNAVTDYGKFLNSRQEQIYILKSSVSITASITRRIHRLISQPIATDSTEEERLIVLQSELGPVVRELVIAPEALPLQLVILDAML
jgi:hypothetical protein